MLPRATVCHTLCGFLVATLAWAGGGSGSVDDPYVISNVEELQAIQDDLAAHYVLGNDIDASGTALWNNGSGFAPIGPPADPFTGVLDGRGHAVWPLHRPRHGAVRGPLRSDPRRDDSRHPHRGRSGLRRPQRRDPGRQGQPGGRSLLSARRRGS